jgi:hypothetical protein
MTFLPYFLPIFTPKTTRYRGLALRFSLKTTFCHQNHRLHVSSPWEHIQWILCIIMYKMSHILYKCIQYCMIIPSSFLYLQG